MNPVPGTETSARWASWQSSRDLVIGIPVPGRDGVYGNDRHIRRLYGLDIGSIGYRQSGSPEPGAIEGFCRIEKIVDHM